jgi:hypothetical protein
VTLHPRNRGLMVPHRDSGFRRLRCQRTHALRFPDPRSPMPPVVNSRQGWTFQHLSSLKHYGCGTRRVSGIRDFSGRDSFVCRKPEMPNPELFQILGHASLGSTVMVVSGNRKSRFRCASVSLPLNSRYPELRTIRDLSPRVLVDGRS